MTSPSGARLAGDDYQHLLSWLYLLGLIMPGSRFKAVRVEDREAGFADDITVRQEPDADEPDQLIQVKYHVDHRQQYSTQVLLSAPPGSRSLLRKLYESWRTLGRRRRPVEIRLVSNWAWAAEDPVPSVIRGNDNGLSAAFFTASPRSAVGKARARWREHLDVTETSSRLLPAPFASTPASTAPRNWHGRPQIG